MQIKNRFEVPLAPDAAWALLMDVAQTAACFPGAELTDSIDADHHKGRVSVRLGPVAMVFAGTIEIAGRDDALHSAAIKANWSETKGRGNAVTATRFVLHDADGATRVEVETDIQLAGQVAQYGRGAGMIEALSAQLVAQFAGNLRARIEASPVAMQKEISLAALAGRALVAQFKKT